MTGAKRKKKSVLWSKMHTLHCEDIKQWCRRRLPILEWAPRYNLKENLLPDTVSGIMLAVQQVTQGLAFAILSSVHPVFGLYGSLFPAIIYAIFGMGRHVATGTFALTSLISANAVERLVPQSSQNLTKHSNSSLLGLSEFEAQRIGVAAAVSFLGGVIQVAMFVLQLGSATFLLTEPVISAMTTGAATHVVTSQVKYLLGIKIPYISGPLGLFYVISGSVIHSLQESLKPKQENWNWAWKQHNPKLQLKQNQNRVAVSCQMTGRELRLSVTPRVQHRTKSVKIVP